MVVTRVNVGEDTVLVLEAAVVTDGRVLHRRERPPESGPERTCGACEQDVFQYDLKTVEYVNDARAAEVDALSMVGETMSEQVAESRDPDWPARACRFGPNLDDERASSMSCA
jgi:hypothetical protein